jgi:hypothetical protein
MPIKQENKARYPLDWPAVRAGILKRAGYRCEHPGCLARQYSVGWWALSVKGWVWCAHWGDNDNPRTYQDARAVAAELYFSRGEEIGDKPTVIVLTIAHLDHQPENSDPQNLRAMCQRHHLAYDQAHHLASAAATRRMASRNGDLFSL